MVVGRAAARAVAPVRNVLHRRCRAVRLGRPDRVQRLLERRTAARLLAAQEDASVGLATGYIDVNGVGGGTTPPAAARVVATGAVQSGQNQSDTFDVAATSDGNGGVGGTFSVSRFGTSVSGSITCLRVVGDEIVVGGQGTIPNGGGGSMTVYVTLYLTDNGPGGTTDSAALDGPTNMAPPDCFSAGPPQQTLYYGQVTILDTPSESGVVSGAGTMGLGGGYTRTFSFDAARAAGRRRLGHVRDLRVQGFSLSGTVDCLEIRGNTATLIGHGPNPGQPFSSYYAAIFVEDVGPGGTGDLVSVNAYRGTAPFDCLAAQEYPGVAIASGDVRVPVEPATPAHPGRRRGHQPERRPGDDHRVGDERPAAGRLGLRVPRLPGRHRRARGRPVGAPDPGVHDRRRPAGLGRARPDRRRPDRVP